MKSAMGGHRFGVPFQGTESWRADTEGVALGYDGPALWAGSLGVLAGCGRRREPGEKGAV